MHGNFITRLRNFVPFILIVIVLLSFALPTPVAAQDIAISGTFYRHHFQLLPGESLSTPDIYVVVFNHDDKDLRIKLIPQAPQGVEIILAESDFLIPPGGQHKVEVGVRLSAEAIPGEYIIAVTAEVHREGEGIVITSAAQQHRLSRCLRLHAEPRR